jgi:hypothetical protein
VLATAILDRLLHRSQVLNITGRSYACVNSSARPRPVALRDEGRPSSRGLTPFGRTRRGRERTQEQEVRKSSCPLSAEQIPSLDSERPRSARDPPAYRVKGDLDMPTATSQRQGLGEEIGRGAKPSSGAGATGSSGPGRPSSPSANAAATRAFTGDRRTGFRGIGAWKSPGLRNVEPRISVRRKPSVLGLVSAAHSTCALDDAPAWRTISGGRAERSLGNLSASIFEPAAPIFGPPPAPHATFARKLHSGLVSEGEHGKRLR